MNMFFSALLTLDKGHWSWPQLTEKKTAGKNKEHNQKDVYSISTTEHKMATPSHCSS